MILRSFSRKVGVFQLTAPLRMLAQIIKNALLAWGLMAVCVGESVGTGGAQASVGVPQGAGGMETHNVAQDSTSLVVIKGKKVKAHLVGTTGSEFIVKTDGTVSRSKNARALIIDGKQRDAMTCQVSIPAGSSIIASAGELDLNIQGAAGDLRIEGGRVHCTSEGPLQNVKVTAGQAKLEIEGVRRDVIVTCGHLEDSRIIYGFKPYFHTKLPQGLAFMRPSVTRLMLASGKMHLRYPAHSRLFYFRDMPGLKTSVAAQNKNYDTRLMVTSPPHGVEVQVDQDDADVLPSDHAKEAPANPRKS